MRTSSTGNRAFTLIEVMVIVVLVAVLGGMTIPRLGGRFSATRLRESARQFLITAQYAHQFATTHRCATRLRIDTTRSCYVLEYEEDPEHHMGKYIPMQNSFGRHRTLEQPVQFGRVWIEPVREDRSEADTVRFDPLGSADPAVIEITDGKRVYSLVLNHSTGRAELIEGRVDELPVGKVDLDA